MTIRQAFRKYRNDILRFGALGAVALSVSACSTSPQNLDASVPAASVAAQPQPTPNGASFSTIATYCSLNQRQILYTTRENDVYQATVDDDHRASIIASLTDGQYVEAHYNTKTGVMWQRNLFDPPPRMPNESGGLTIDRVNGVPAFQVSQSTIDQLITSRQFQKVAIDAITDITDQFGTRPASCANAAARRLGPYSGPAGTR